MMGIKSDHGNLMYLFTLQMMFKFNAWKTMGFVLGIEESALNVTQCHSM